jgi:hypothetical protein
VADLLAMPGHEQEPKFGLIEKEQMAAQMLAILASISSGQTVKKSWRS